MRADVGTVKNRANDYLAIIEAAYSTSGSDAVWVQGIADAARSTLDQGQGVYAWSYDATNLAACRVGAFGQAGGTRDLEQGARDFVQALSPGAATQLFPPTPPVEFLRRIFGRAPPTPEMQEVLSQLAVGDAIGVRGHNTDGRGVVLAAVTSGVASLPPRANWALTRVAPHLSAAARLRFERARPDPLDDADAIFSARGRLQHFADGIEPEATRALPGAVEKRLAANTVRAEPRQALELWTALIDGRWSIVDHVDRDGKRFLLARKNVPGVVDPSALTSSERLVLLYASWGHSNALISYETGFSPSSVSSKLKRILRKLRLESRADLARLFDPARRSD